MNIIVTFFLCCSLGCINSDIYGSITCADYVTGKFHSSQCDTFIVLSEHGIPTRGRKLYLRREAAQALKRLYEDFRVDHPDIPFWIQSATRNFYDQKFIWESKWNGKTRVGGRNLLASVKDPLERAREILKYSSMPGTSRHHWGSDVDFNVLNNDYYRKGPGAVLYRWLVKNAGRYGFCQPYISGRKGGYCEERWHWSYIPLAGRFIKDWNSLYKENPGAFSRIGLFAGSEYAGYLAPAYVNDINEECK